MADKSHLVLRALRCNISAIRSVQSLRIKTHCVRCKHTTRYPLNGTSSQGDTSSRIIKIPINSKYSLRVICSNFSTSDAGGGGKPPNDKANIPDHEIKVKPAKKKPEPPQKYLSNVFITPLRAMREYLLTPSELSLLWNTKRRSPYENSPPITVYLRHEVEQKAKEKYGSLELLEKEKTKARRQEELYIKGLSSNRPMMFDYREEYSDAPKNDKRLEKQRKTIFKSGSGKVVLTAIVINSVNAVVKCVAWLYTGSHAMFAEAVHSLADTLNQCILAYGIHHSLKNPNPDHPYGYSNFRYVSSLISGVGIFCVGAGFAWYHGIAGILTKTELVDMTWAIMLLGGSFLSESVTLLMAVQNIKRKSKQANQSFYEYVARGTDPSVNVVLMEDLAAVCGVVVAGSCMYMSHVTANHIPDAVGSLIIGTLLAGVSTFIIKTNSNALLGRSIPEVNKKELTATLEADMMIRSVHDIKATDMGANLIRFKAEVDIDGRLLTKKYLDELNLKALLMEMKTLESTDDVEVFLIHHGEKIVELIGGEIDRIEDVLKLFHQTYPTSRNRLQNRESNVRKEVKHLKSQVALLESHNRHLERENQILRSAAAPETLARLNSVGSTLPPATLTSCK